MCKQNANQVIERIKAAVGVSTDSELCRVTNTNRQALSNWKTRNSVPYTLCVKVANDLNVSIDWLLTGDGEMLRGVTSQASSSNLAPKEEALLTMFKELSEDDQREICRLAEDKKRLHDMSKQIEELQAWFEEFKKAH